MRILFLAYKSFDFYKPIEDELIRQGHYVHTITDKLLPYDYNSMASSYIKRVGRRIIRGVLQIEKKYWREEFKKDELIGDYYDLVLCYQGVSMCKELLNFLKRFNPEIKSCVYIGDSSNYYNFFSKRKLFNKIYTFDLEDSKKFEEVELLDPYWQEQTDNVSIEYDLSAIGSDHDDRFEFTAVIYPQILASGLKSFIKVVTKNPNIDSLPDKEKKKAVLEWEKRKVAPFVTVEPIPFDEFHRIIKSSNCILEIEREHQSGITIRSLSAIANGKKVITTNKYLKERSYFNPEQVRIIDRVNPKLDVEWIRKRDTFTRPEAVERVRLDRWVNILLEGFK